MDRPRRSFPPDDPRAAWRRLESRLAAGRPPGCGDLRTLWETYQAAVVHGQARGEHRLPDDLVSDLLADHHAMARELRQRPGFRQRPGYGIAAAMPDRRSTALTRSRSYVPDHRPHRWADPAGAD